VITPAGDSHIKRIGTAALGIAIPMKGDVPMSFNAEKYTKSEWLHGSDLDEGKATRATIKSAYEHEFERDNQTKPVIEFYELEQKMVLNKTQTKALVMFFGPSAGGWINQVVELMPGPGYQGKPTIIISRAGPDRVPTVSFQGGKKAEPAVQNGAQAQTHPEMKIQQ
jgi:hypothetical protein